MDSRVGAGCFVRVTDYDSTTVVSGMVSGTAGDVASAVAASGVASVGVASVGGDSESLTVGLTASEEESFETICSSPSKRKTGDRSAVGGGGSGGDTVGLKTDGGGGPKTGDRSAPLILLEWRLSLMFFWVSFSCSTEDG
ncbi:hypothetical protein L6452_26193 [Arctium lappa]|uniref:Uncharacterized protein n=1 Tax=Arctium lappa TaxID=4217 RepID=A0ACB9ABS1_ARCLA|nr:hypothetical protein L6452_26193 [Arctium lappa]